MHGFKVKAVYLDGISPEEKETFDWLREHAPELELIAHEKEDVDKLIDFIMRG